MSFLGEKSWADQEEEEKSWADQEEEENLRVVAKKGEPQILSRTEYQSEEDPNFKTIVEEKIREDGKKVRTTKKTRLTTRKKKADNPRVEERKNWKKFGIAISGLGDIPRNQLSVEGDPIQFEFANKPQQSAVQTIPDEQEQVLRRIEEQYKREVQEEQEKEEKKTGAAAAGGGAGAGGTSSRDKEKSSEGSLEPSTGAYVPPHLRGKGSGASADSYESYDDESENTTIKISNLDGEVTESDLRVLFNKSRLRVQRIFLPTGQDGRNRSFAIVTFHTKIDAQKAIEKFHRFSLNHLLLHLEWGEDRRN